MLDEIITAMEKQAGSANVTLRTLSLGSRNSTTGWCAMSFSDSTIKMVIVPKGSSFRIMSMGFYAYRSTLGFTTSTVHLDDEIKDANNVYHRITDYERIEWLNQFVGWKVSLEEMPLHG